MNFAALLGCSSGRATPSLRRNPKAHHDDQPARQESTYLSCGVVQTNKATSQSENRMRECEAYFTASTDCKQIRIAQAPNPAGLTGIVGIRWWVDQKIVLARFAPP